MTNLSAAGLTIPETNCYTALLTRKDWKPADLAKFVGETRTNCYKILDNLVALGLAERFDKDKKLHYSAANPGRLLVLSRAARAKRDEAEKELEVSAANLMSEYVKTHEQPGVSFFQGSDEIMAIYDTYESADDDIYYIHTTAGTKYHGKEAMDMIRAKALQSNIRRHGLTPISPYIASDYKTRDALVQLDRTWVAAKDYTAPVEWGAFGNKLYIISYGQDAIGMIIESEQIAKAFKQIYTLIERGQRAQPGYNELLKNMPQTKQNLA